MEESSNLVRKISELNSDPVPVCRLWLPECTWNQSVSKWIKITACLIYHCLFLWKQHRNSFEDSRSARQMSLSGEVPSFWGVEQDPTANVPVGVPLVEPWKIGSHSHLAAQNTLNSHVRVVSKVARELSMIFPISSFDDVPPLMTPDVARCLFFGAEKNFTCLRSAACALPRTGNPTSDSHFWKPSEGCTSIGVKRYPLVV